MLSLFKFNPPMTLSPASDIRNSSGMYEVMWRIYMPWSVACIMNSNHRYISYFTHLIHCCGTNLFAILSLYLSLSKKNPPVGITNLVWFSFPTIFSSSLPVTLMLLFTKHIRSCISLFRLMNFYFSNFTLNIYVFTSQPNIILMGW